MSKICYVTTIALTLRSFFIPQIKYLAEHGFDVTVVCSPDEQLQYELGGNIKYCPIKIARGISPMSINRTIKDLTELFQKECFDIVQYSTPNAAFCASIAAKRAGIKIRNYHLMGLRYLGMNGVVRYMFKRIEKLTCDFSTHIECITPSNLKLSVKEGLFPKEKVTIVGNGSTGGVDMKRFNYDKRNEWCMSVRKELGLSEDEFVFGFVGRITRDKGINEILKAFLAIKGNCRLLIIGSKEGLKTLDQGLWIAAENNTDIIIHDSVKDIERYYSAMDMLLLPSYREGFGMVIAEAAAMGTPAIVSDIPGPVDVIVEGKTAFTVGVKDAGALKNRMQFCYDNSEKIKAMSANCTQYIKDTYDSEKLCEAILERKNNLLKCI